MKPSVIFLTIITIICYSTNLKAQTPFYTLQHIRASDDTVMGSITSGSVIITTNATTFSINAIPSTSVGSTTFALSGAITHNQTETSAPYALYGDGGPTSTDFTNGPDLIAGSYTLAITAWSSSGGTGNQIAQDIINFTVTEPTTGGGAGNWTLNNQDVYYNNGNVGIGTSTPSVNLEVYAEANPSILINSGGVGSNRLQLGVASCNGCFHQNATPGTAVIRNLGTSHDLILAMPNFNNDGNSNIRINDSQNLDTFIVYNNGKVTIGTENMPTILGNEDISNYKLFVNGGILTEEVRVQTSWADYVFDPVYELKPLSEVEAFIKANKYLPNMPSAQTVKENGLELGNIIKIQQEKIEELMLYTIEQQKLIEKLEKDKTELQSLSKRLAEIEKLLINKEH